MFKTSYNGCQEKGGSECENLLLVKCNTRFGALQYWVFSEFCVLVLIRPWLLHKSIMIYPRGLCVVVYQAGEREKNTNEPHLNLLG